MTSLLLARSLSLTSMAATAKRWPGPVLSGRVPSIAAVESTEMVYYRPLSCLWSAMLRAWQMVNTSTSKLHAGLAKLFIFCFGEALMQKTKYRHIRISAGST